MIYANKNAKKVIFVKYTLQNSQKYNFTYSRLGILHKNVLSLHQILKTAQNYKKFLI